jgi:hypothetical protein
MDQLLTLRTALPIGQQTVARRAHIVDRVSADFENFAFRVNTAKTHSRINVVLIETETIQGIEMQEVAGIDTRTDSEMFTSSCSLIRRWSSERSR